MNKLCLLACLFVSVAATAQTGPTVVFTGDDFVYGWQQNAAFTANKNWIGAGVDGGGFDWGFSQAVLDGFQTNVIDRHPAFVFLDTGTMDIAFPSDSTPYPAEWQNTATLIIKMVQMAQGAGIKVILGTVFTSSGFESDHFNGWLQTYATAENIPFVNFESALATGINGPYCSPWPCNPTPLLDNSDPGFSTPTDAGYQLITQMAQAAIATYSLKIKSGYLNNVLSVTGYGIDDEFGGSPLQRSVNTINSGAAIQFTPQATWSDGVTRPMLNIPYGGVLGTWSSTNPKVMAVNQQGFAFSYTSGTATISFKSASGITFSPWNMTVYPEEILPGIPEPEY
jgi:hypothetical protein